MMISNILPANIEEFVPNILNSDTEYNKGKQSKIIKYNKNGAHSSHQKNKVGR